MQHGSDFVLKSYTCINKEKDQEYTKTWSGLSLDSENEEWSIFLCFCFLLLCIPQFFLWWVYTSIIIKIKSRGFFKDKDIPSNCSISVNPEVCKPETQLWKEKKILTRKGQGPRLLRRALALAALPPPALSITSEQLNYDQCVVFSIEDLSSMGERSLRESCCFCGCNEVWNVLLKLPSRRQWTTGHRQTTDAKLGVATLCFQKWALELSRA